MTKVEVAWCRSCEHWLPAAEIGQFCPETDCIYRLTRRVGYICASRGLHHGWREAKNCEVDHGY